MITFVRLGQGNKIRYFKCRFLISVPVHSVPVYLQKDNFYIFKVLFSLPILTQETGLKLRHFVYIYV